MPIEGNIQFAASAAAARAAVQQEQPQTAPTTGAAPVLGGPGVSVSVSGSQLDKLVEKVKGESDDARLAAAKRRIAIVLTVLSALNIQISDNQKSALAQLEGLGALLDELNEKLKSGDSSLLASEAALAALQAKTEELAAAVERAVKEGEAHRAQVEELKRTRSADDAELRAAETALAKSEAAATAAKASLDKNRADIDAAKTNVEAAKANIANLKSQIASTEKKIADCTSAVGDKALAAIAAGLRTESASHTNVVGDRETESDREKAEAKQKANDPVRAIRAALDRMDADILRTIEENRMILV